MINAPEKVGYELHLKLKSTVYTFILSKYRWSVNQNRERSPKIATK